MKVTAILAIRNEAAYLANCLRHLVRNSIDFVVIDNGSTDDSPEIYRRREFAANLVAVEELSYHGVFSLAEQLRKKLQIAEILDTDWIIHLDADEIMHSYREGESLNAAFCRLDADNWNVVNFDEFVFLPTETDYVADTTAHYQPLHHYYYFSPQTPRLMRAWRKTGSLSMVETGGHLLIGDGIRLAPEHFALRHYIVRNQEHAFTKYTTRAFAAEELVLGWHHARAQAPANAFVLPPAAVLKRLADAGQRSLDRSEPWTAHYWLRFEASSRAGLAQMSEREQA